MPSDADITTIPYEALVHKGLEATTEYERKTVEYEMWRRSIVVAERSMLVAQETGRGGESAGRWALYLAYMAAGLAVLIAWTTSTAMQAITIIVVAVLLFTSLAGARHGLMASVLIGERMYTRKKLIEFDKAHPVEAQQWAYTGLLEIGIPRPEQDKRRRWLRGIRRRRP